MIGIFCLQGAYQDLELRQLAQVHGQSPVQFNYVNPEDDPSRKK